MKPPRFSCHRAVHRLLLLVVVVWDLGAPLARAWNPTGHRLVASMTFDQLSPAERTRWAALLRLHPDFDQWSAAEPKNQPGFDEGRYLLMRASTWPDEIRKSGSSYDHPVWHYVHYPLEGPEFLLESAATGTDDILSAIARCRDVLADSKAAGSERAAHLSWLIHLVGDLQQPLHCATLIGPEYSRPDGDGGGGAFYVTVGGAAISLHWYWDCLPGTATDGKEIIEQGRKLAEKFPRAALPELTRASDPQAWSLEGRALCLEAVYRRGVLRGAKTEGPDDPPLPEGYAPAARALAERRVALAAYRLTDTLTALPPEP